MLPEGPPQPDVYNKMSPCALPRHGIPPGGSKHAEHLCVAFYVSLASARVNEIQL